MNTNKKIILWTLGAIMVIGITMIVLGGIFFDGVEEGIEVECYDKYGNKIKGVVCEEIKHYMASLTKGGFWVFGISYALFFYSNVL